ncbi:MAG: fatty acid desaturase family protein [Paracoccaceae bacterium]|nr:fatty acid desaturase family protein [Paracoccaceae bacterium]
MTATDAQTATIEGYVPKRDYRLNGDRANYAIQLGLASAEWYHSDISRKSMKALMRRSDRPALTDTLIWFGLLFLTGLGGAIFWGQLSAVPFFIVYGVLYGSASDSRWHECGHGTAFKTRWMNDFVYHISSFMVVRNPITWRWSHARHHTDTIIVGRDPEISLVRPQSLAEATLRFIGIISAPQSLLRLVRNSLGILTDDERNYIPTEEKPKVVFWARIHSIIYIATITLCVIFWSILPLMLIGFPRLYGCWHMVMMGILQHGGLAEDVTDHRMNSRTVYINPISRWLYWNMNYHIEHHMFPMVPYHALPQLHELIRHDLPKANKSIFDAYYEVIKAIWRQQKEPDFYIEKELPATAKPFRQEFHDIEIER